MKKLDIIKHGKVAGSFIMLVMTSLYLFLILLAFVSGKVMLVWKEIGPTLIHFFTVNLGVYVVSKKVRTWRRGVFYGPENDQENP